LSLFLNSPTVSVSRLNALLRDKFHDCLRTDISTVRSLAKKCLSCAALSFDEAVALHGEGGDNCWDERICHRRRSHYRHRAENNFQRRRSYKAKKVLQIEIAPPTTYSAVLVLYRARKDTPLHAIAAQIWQGNDRGCRNTRSSLSGNGFESGECLLKKYFGSTQR
jgi:hypothetical protein